MGERMIYIARGGELAQDLVNLEAGITKRTTQRLYAASLVLATAIRKEAHGGTLKAGRGKLAQSWKPFPVRVRGKYIEGGAGSDQPYAAIQEFGGPISAKPGHALTIPLTDEARRKRAADFPDLFVYKSPRGKVFLARQKMRSRGRNTLEMVYQLVRSVKLPATRYITKAQEAAEPRIFVLMDEAVMDELHSFERGH